MSPLTVAMWCGILFVAFNVLAVVLQVRKMQNFHKDAKAFLERGN